jgi:sulfite exporter TauE/SafE
MAWTALILGFAGSLHCLGMCSPLAIAVTNQSSTFSFARIAYNFGRILTYGFLGSTVATVGLIFPMVKFQNLLSIILGIGLVIIGIVGISTIRIPVITSSLAKLNYTLKSLFSKILRNRNFATTFLLGSLNGLLPCGLTFLALTYCVTLSGPLGGFNFMILFGFGTLPVMLGFTSVFKWLISILHFSSQRLTTGLLIVSGVLLIVRVFVVHLPESASFNNAVIDIAVCW